MTLPFNPRQDRVMIHMHTKTQIQRSVGWKFKWKQRDRRINLISCFTFLANVVGFWNCKRRYLKPHVHEVCDWKFDVSLMSYVDVIWLMFLVSLLRDLKHANIVTLHDIIHTDSSLTLVFEYLVCISPCLHIIVLLFCCEGYVYRLVVNINFVLELCVVIL